MKELEAGLKATVSWTVTEQLTAESCRSGALPVFATPFLVALMEAAACAVIEEYLPEGSTSVGAAISVQHSAPSPVGAAVVAEAVLTEVSGRSLSFEITAHDDHGVIGTATHKRAIVDAQRFMSKLANR